MGHCYSSEVKGKAPPCSAVKAEEEDATSNGTTLEPSNSVITAPPTVGDEAPQEAAVAEVPRSGSTPVLRAPALTLCVEKDEVLEELQSPSALTRLLPTTEPVMEQGGRLVSPPATQALPQLTMTSVLAMSPYASKGRRQLAASRIAERFGRRDDATPGQSDTTGAPEVAPASTDRTGGAEAGLLPPGAPHDSPHSDQCSPRGSNATPCDAMEPAPLAAAANTTSKDGSRPAHRRLPVTRARRPTVVVAAKRPLSPTAKSALPGPRSRTPSVLSSTTHPIESLVSTVSRMSVASIVVPVDGDDVEVPVASETVAFSSAQALHELLRSPAEAPTPSQQTPLPLVSEQLVLEPLSDTADPATPPLCTPTVEVPAKALTRPAAATTGQADATSCDGHAAAASEAACDTSTANESAAALSPRSVTREDIIRDGSIRLERRVDELRLFHHRVKGDGNCQFRSLSQQLLGSEEFHEVVRDHVVSYMRGVRAEKFDHYFESTAAADEYFNKVQRVGAWGDELTLRGASDSLYINIHVLTSESSHFYMTYRPEPDAPPPPLFLVDATALKRLHRSKLQSGDSTPRGSMLSSPHPMDSAAAFPPRPAEAAMRRSSSTASAAAVKSPRSSPALAPQSSSGPVTATSIVSLCSVEAVHPMATTTAAVAGRAESPSSQAEKSKRPPATPESTDVDVVYDTNAMQRHLQRRIAAVGALRAISSTYPITSPVSPPIGPELLPMERTRSTSAGETEVTLRGHGRSSVTGVSSRPSSFVPSSGAPALAGLLPPEALPSPVKDEGFSEFSSMSFIAGDTSLFADSGGATGKAKGPCCSGPGAIRKVAPAPRNRWLNRASATTASGRALLTPLGKPRKRPSGCKGGVDADAEMSEYGGPPSDSRRGPGMALALPATRSSSCKEMPARHSRNSSNALSISSGSMGGSAPHGEKWSTGSPNWHHACGSIQDAFRFAGATVSRRDSIQLPTLRRRRTAVLSSKTAVAGPNHLPPLPPSSPAKHASRSATPFPAVPVSGQDAAVAHGGGSGTPTTAAVSSPLERHPSVLVPVPDDGTVDSNMFLVIHPSGDAMGDAVSGNPLCDEPPPVGEVPTGIVSGEPSSCLVTFKSREEPIDVFLSYLYPVHYNALSVPECEDSSSLWGSAAAPGTAPGTTPSTAAATDAPVPVQDG